MKIIFFHILIVIQDYPVFLEEAPLTKNALLPVAELAQKVLLKFNTVKSEPGHCIVRCELDRFGQKLKLISYNDFDFLF